MIKELEKDTKVIVEHKTCGFHQSKPFENFAGCTCMSSYSLVRKGIK